MGSLQTLAVRTTTPFQMVFTISSFSTGIFAVEIGHGILF